MKLAEARQALLAQHARIRRRFSRCTALAHRIRYGEPIQPALDDALDGMRRELAAHNLIETAMLRPWFADLSGWGQRLLDRMFEEHVAERAVFDHLLGDPAAEIVLRIDDLIDELDAHMAAEERTFLSPQVLRSV